MNFAGNQCEVVTEYNHSLPENYEYVHTNSIIRNSG
jgi:hypothetical protein